MAESCLWEARRRSLAQTRRRALELSLSLLLLSLLVLLLAARPGAAPGGAKELGPLLAPLLQARLHLLALLRHHPHVVAPHL